MNYVFEDLYCRQLVCKLVGGYTSYMLLNNTGGTSVEPVGVAVTMYDLEVLFKF